MADDVLLDVSELVRRPLHTGIQRVTRELVRAWAGPGRLVLCTYDPDADALRYLPDEATTLVTAAPAGPELAVEAEAGAFEAMSAAHGLHLVPPGTGPILNVELFFDPSRLRFYERLADAGRTDVFWLVYDLLPWLHPEWFPQFAGRPGLRYVHAAMRMPRRGFISERTRHEFHHRCLRDPAADGPVIALGGDGLELERQVFRPGRDRYVTLGSLEPRKRTADVMEAFTELWRAGSRARLTVIGRPMPGATREAALIAALADEPRFTLLPNASDEAVRDALRDARALLFPSASEGFGLPPFEALHCGIPVVAAPGVPSLDMLAPGGRVLIEPPDAAGIAAAVRRLEDDGLASRLWAEAARLTVPTWRAFAAQVGAWLAATPPSPAGHPP